MRTPTLALAKVGKLQAKLVTPPIRYSKPELQAHIQYLYSMTLGADQKIGRDAVERLGSSASNSTRANRRRRHCSRPRIM
ncbi:MAG: hypothetical protein U0163_20180 [Gemmatimonadaceae bacterium]